MKPPYRIRYNVRFQRYELHAGNRTLRRFRRGTTLRHVESVFEDLCTAWFITQRKATDAETIIGETVEDSRS
jgi:hypothetical protein